MTAPLEDQRDEHRCAPCGRRVSQGWSLCNRCSERLADNLLEIADRYQHLSAASGYQPGRFDRSGGGKPGSRPPGRTDVMALRDFRSGQSEPTTWRGADGRHHAESDRDTPAVLRAVLGWCECIAAERGFTTQPWAPTPLSRRPGPARFGMTDHDEMTGYVDHRAERHRAMLEAELDRLTRVLSDAPSRHLTAAASWLCRQDDWLARWAHAGELFDAVKLLRNRLRAATGEPNPRPMASCIALSQRDPAAPSTECGAAVFPPPPDEAAPSYVPVVRCTGPDRHEYTRSDLTRLAIATERARREREAG